MTVTAGAYSLAIVTVVSWLFVLHGCTAARLHERA
jgi:hypothetical protein